MILKDLLENLTLLPGERGNLHARGFTDDVLEKYQLKSCHPINAFVLDSLKNKYTVEQLREEVLYEADTNHQGVYTPQRQILESNILIPYFESSRHIIKVRPHKLGFRGQGASVYRCFTSFQPSDVCVIAESEFKAIAAECLGYSAVGIPGIASMSGRNWDYFSKQLEDIPAKEFVICFDNEIKDNPALKNFKPDWRKRYDTTIYAYAMAQKILDLGKSCRIATLPTDWMVEGKIDIDLALAQCRGQGAFKSIIDGSQGPKAFIENAPIPQKHRSFINRRIRRFFYEPAVELRHNAFYSKAATNPDGTTEGGARLSNCSVKIKNVYEELSAETEGVSRDVIITDEYGVASKLTPLKPSSMATKSGMKEWLMSQGNYLFYGSDNDLIKIWEYVFSFDDGNIVYLVNRCGYIKELDFYLFKNVLIKDGKAVYPDEYGIFWVDEVGYKPHAPHMDCQIPAVLPEGKFDVSKFLRLLSDTTDHDNPGMGKAMFAYMLAILFIDSIQEQFKLFPILFVYGERGGGKTTVMRWLTSFFGQDKATLNLGMSSVVGVNRGLEYYSSLPFVTDDWRNIAKFQAYIPVFLGVYNRQSGIKGTKAKFGIQKTTINAALVVMGEEIFPDNALLSRCISFYFPTVRLRECSEEMESIIQEASSFFFKILTGSYSRLKNKVISNIKEASKEFKLKVRGLDARVAINYAILAGTYRAVMGEDAEMEEHLMTMMGAGQADVTEGDRIHKFANEFLVGVAEGVVKPHHFLFKGDSVFLWVKGICDVLNKFYNRSDIENGALITQHFKKQSFYLGTQTMQTHGTTAAVPCIELSLTGMPESLRVILEGARHVSGSD